MSNQTRSVVLGAPIAKSPLSPALSGNPSIARALAVELYDREADAEIVRRTGKWPDKLTPAQAARLIAEFQQEKAARR